MRGKWEGVRGRLYEGKTRLGVGKKKRGQKDVGNEGKRGSKGVKEGKR